MLVAWSGGDVETQLLLPCEFRFEQFYAVHFKTTVGVGIKN